MEPTKKTARITGLIYLILILTGMFALLYVPSQLIVWDDAAMTVKNIRENQLLFRTGILSNLVCFSCFILLPLGLYKLLNHVSKKHAVLMVVFAITSVPISYLNIANHLDILSILNEDYLRVFDESQVNASIMMLLESYRNGNMVAHVFWGLWLWPFGYLVYKSGVLPKFLGVMLMLGCFGYLIDFVGYFLFDAYSETVVSTIAGLPASIGEIGICLWLLIIGVKTKRIEIAAQN